MKPRRLPRNTKALGVQLNFTAPAPEVEKLDEAAALAGLTRSSFMYRAVARETRRVLRQHGIAVQRAAA